MGKELVAKGQVTITTLEDSYHISQSIGEYIFPALPNGIIASDVTVVSTIKVTQGNVNITNFTIGTISKPAGFSNIVVDNIRKAITYTIAANTNTLPDHGCLLIPVLVGGNTYHLSFQWTKIKDGASGSSGKDGYTVRSSRQDCIIATDENGRIHTAVTVSTVISALRGTTVVTPIIGTLPTVTGCSLSKSGTTVTLIFNTGLSLAERGVIDLPVIVDGITFSIPFSYAKARAGAPGVDANLLDWVNEWNNNKTLINDSTVITPKIFAGVKNSDSTLTGMAIGRFMLSVKAASGSITREMIDGVYGFKDGTKTFFVDNSGNVQLGGGNEFVKYNALTGKIEFGSGVSLNWAGATYIDKNGIFTGTLSANVIDTLQLNASQITSGTIATERIDVNSLKSVLITAGNIDALTLNVTKGKIGSWTIDGDSIYRATKNNTSGGFTSTSGAVTLGTNGLRGFKWRLDATGAGAIAGNGIVWDAEGKIVFGASVTVQWTAPINSLITALGGAGYPKLTKITATGIYTGSVTASQINAGTISADRFAAGSINASKLDAESIKSSIINVDYINGLSCTFDRGKVGGWTIGESALTNTHIALDNGNKCIVVYGANSGITNGQRVQLYYKSDLDFGLYATDTSGGCVAQLGSANKIAGWLFDAKQIYKNNVCFGSDGTISNSSKWIFRNDGSGQVANGNISWDTAGTVSFSQAVSLNWKNDIEAAKSANFGYRYYKQVVIYGESGTYYPVIIKGGDQTIKRDILVRRSYGEQAPSDWDNKSSTHKGGLILLIKTNFGSLEGAAYSWDIYELSEIYSRMFAGAELCGYSCMFAVYLRGGGKTGSVYHIYSDQPIENNLYSPSPIPGSPQIAYNSDLIFQSGDSKAYAPAPRTLTTAVDEEIRRHRFITLAQANDSTLAAHPLTFIGSTGIYTGTLTATQVNAVNINASSIHSGQLSADRIAAGSIYASKLNAASIQSDIINADYISGLSCTFERGMIGGWTIGADNIMAGNVGTVGTVPIQIRSKASGSGYWFNGAYKPYGVCITWNQSGNAGHIVFGQIASSGNAVKSDFIGIQMMSQDNLEYFCISSNYTRSGSKEVYNRIAGWAFDHNHIWKNNISLGSDGSIANSSCWRLNNDGSGQLANGNISWNTSGIVTFASSVSMQWTTGITTAQELASAMAFGLMLHRDPTFFNGNNSIGTYNDSGNGTVIITRLQDSTAPNNSKYVLKVQTNGAASPGNGGFYFGNQCSSRKVFVTRIIAKIPVGRNIQSISNGIGSNGSSRWLTSNAGTGDWKEYVYKIVCGTSNFSSSNYFYIDGVQATTNAPVVWYIAYATVFDLTSSEKYTTTIDTNGVYTGTVRANQVIVDSELVVGGSNYNGSISVRDTNNNVNVTLDRSGIKAVAGRIGGWIINDSTICAALPPTGHRVYLTSSGYLYNDDGSKDYWGLRPDGSATFGYGKISFAANGSGFVANGNLSWDAAGNLQAKNAVFSNVRVNGSVRNKFVLNDSSIWIGGNSSTQENFNNYDNIVAIRGSWDEDIALPWTLENSGRRVTLVNYKWGANTTIGYMSISAPSGKYFFEDGMSRTSISFSRELIELLGYGDNSTFFGWIVVNRRDLMTTKRYGKFAQVMCQGFVSNGSMVKQKCYDGSRCTCSRLDTGLYRVYMPYSFSSTNDYTVHLTGVVTNAANTFAVLRTKYTSFFDVWTADDATANDGGFTFWVISMADWD